MASTGKWVKAKQIKNVLIVLSLFIGQEKKEKFEFKIFPNCLRKKTFKIRIGLGKGNPEEWIEVVKVRYKGGMATEVNEECK